MLGILVHLDTKMFAECYKVCYKFGITWSFSAFCEKWATLIELNRLQRMRCFILNREAINLAALIVSKTQIVSSFGSRGKGDLSTIDIYPSVDNNKGYKGRGKANTHFTEKLFRFLKEFMKRFHLKKCISKKVWKQNKSCDF